MTTKAELEAQAAAEAARKEQAVKLRQFHKDTRVPDRTKLAQKPTRYKDKETGQWVQGKPLDYLGHADATDLILAHDPHWNWEPVAWTDQGLPGIVKDKEGWPIGLWIRLTIHGVTRLGYGSCPSGKDDAVKELIGDAIRNASMRFGMALQLWSKADAAGWGDLPEPTDDDDGAPSAPQDAAPAAPAPESPSPPAAPEKPAQPPQASSGGQCPDCHAPPGRSHATACPRREGIADQPTTNGQDAVNDPLTAAAAEHDAADQQRRDALEAAAVAAEAPMDSAQLRLEVGTRLNAMRGPTAVKFAEAKKEHGWPGDLTTADDATLSQILEWLKNSPVERVTTGA